MRPSAVVAAPRSGICAFWKSGPTALYSPEIKGPTTSTFLAAIIFCAALTHCCTLPFVSAISTSKWILPSLFTSSTARSKPSFSARPYEATPPDTPFRKPTFATFAPAAGFEALSLLPLPPHPARPAIAAANISPSPALFIIFFISIFSSPLVVNSKSFLIVLLGKSKVKGLRFAIRAN